MTENELIKKCLESNSLAQRELMDRYAPMLYSVALRYAVDRSEAKDILQDSMIKIYNGLPGYKNQGKFTSWMTKITINTALRKKSKKSYKNTISVDSFYDEPIEGNLGLEELKYEDVLRLVNQLPEVSRDVFKMAVIDGVRHREIAEILGIEESTSRAHLTRAKKKLQGLIKQLEKIEYHGE